VTLLNKKNSERFRGEYTHEKALYKCPVFILILRTSARRESRARARNGKKQTNKTFTSGLSITTKNKLTTVASYYNFKRKISFKDCRRRIKTWNQNHHFYFPAVF